MRPRFSFNNKWDIPFRGTVHTKAALYGREFGIGPLHAQNSNYVKVLKSAGVLATEMESSVLFVLSKAMSQRQTISPISKRENYEIVAGAILAVVGDDEPFGCAVNAKLAVDMAIEIGLNALKMYQHKFEDQHNLNQ